MTRPLEIIKNLKIHIHGIPYVATLIVLQIKVVDFNYTMLLGRPWLRDTKVIIVQGNGIVKIISINKKLGAETKRRQVLVYYDLLEALIDENEYLIFETKPEMFSIGIITF
jgi:hypothetical protein